MPKGVPFSKNLQYQILFYKKSTSQDFFKRTLAGAFERKADFQAFPAGR